MEDITFIIGLLCLLLIGLDIFWTTLWVDGGSGPVSRWIAKAVWKTFKSIGRNHPKFLSLAGPFILVFTLLSWIVLLWLGWLLLFLGDPQAITDTRDNQPIRFIELLYFTGFTIFTLGIGDYVPKAGFWQVATVIASGNGMLFITLGVTYVLSVLNAVTLQRSFASTITGLGMSGSEFVKKTWNGDRFRNTDLLLNSASSQLNTLTAQHKAYPILHHYHPSDLDQSATIGVTILDEALTLLELGIQENHQPDFLYIEEARSSISSYLKVIPANIRKKASQVPPAPDVDGLRKQGLPVVDADAFADRLHDLKERRAILLSLVTSDARSWPTNEK